MLYREICTEHLRATAYVLSSIYECFALSLPILPYARVFLFALLAGDHV